MTVNRCCACGSVIPEGRQVCPTCENWIAPYEAKFVVMTVKKVDRKKLKVKYYCRTMTDVKDAIAEAKDFEKLTIVKIKHHC